MASMKNRKPRGRRPSKKTVIGILLAGVSAWLLPLVSGQNLQSHQRHSVEMSRSAERSAAPEIADAVSGKVIRVMDGDTIEVLSVSSDEKHPVRVRLTGIDAPEKAQSFGEVCRKKLADRVAAREVRVDTRGKDRYSRTLGVIWLTTPNGEVDINLQQIEAGCAWHYKQYQRQQKPDERVRYSDAEARARSGRLGLWQDPDPVPPWKFRREGRAHRRRPR